MGCFDNLVSLREYCTPVAPLSGKYLNDAGLTKSIIEDIITGDAASVKQMVEQITSWAIDEVTGEVYTFFAKSIKTHSPLETGVSGVAPDSVYTTLAGGDYRGQMLTLNNGANYLNFHLSALSLFVDFSGVVDVLVYDLNQNLLLDTIPVTAVAGKIVEVYPSKVYSSTGKPLNLFIGYDATAISSYKTLTRPSVCCGNYGRKTEYLRTHGVSLSGQFIKSNVTYINDTAGVGIQYGLWCDSQSWLCAYSKLLATPIIHKIAAEIFRRGYMVAPTSRSNNSTNTNQELLKNNHEWHENRFRELMASMLSRLHLPSDSVCFSCSPAVRNKIILP